MSKNPIALVKEQFGDKKKLVEAVQALADGDLWLGRTSKDKGLAHVSNAKLLRLHATFGQVKERFGTRAKLIDAVLEIEKRAKDAGYKTRLEAFPVPRLFDLLRSAEKRTGVKQPKAAKPKSAAAPKTAAAAPAGAKKSAAKAAPAAGAKKAAAPAAKKSAAKKSSK